VLYEGPVDRERAATIAAGLQGTRAHKGKHCLVAAPADECLASTRPEEAQPGNGYPA